VITLAIHTTAVTDATFEQEVLKSTTPVLVDFWAPWCGPCKMVGPVLEEIAQERTGTLKIVKLNVDDEQGYAGQLGIVSIPTMILFNNGQAVGKFVGFRPKTEMVKLIDQTLASLTAK
jgi:thioredoxin 1